ncbi:hypothetical protein Y032_0335g2873 [Ancylostoma ceylanicum]|uniref:Superoxide dismutase [Cu-Zn] n=1 Tax=Ancylostoma ceylanicum TaxID=53326 RepID=A0A016RYK2_9BILA|nr:hypothetical protein Y032_0335g2873 [Ancylostoma ceylanicum]
MITVKLICYIYTRQVAANQFDGKRRAYLKTDRAGGPITIKGDIRGFPRAGHHGFHVHQLGDLTNGCISAGPHYNPGNNNHGGPSDNVRHVGDLGNIQADNFGVARFWLRDSQVMIGGMQSVIGRAVVVHANVDDLGRGVGAAQAESLRTGNAGARLACGVIGIAA